MLRESEVAGDMEADELLRRLRHQVVDQVGGALADANTVTQDQFNVMGKRLDSLAAQMEALTTMLKTRLPPPSLTV